MISPSNNKNFRIANWFSGYFVKETSYLHDWLVSSITIKKIAGALIQAYHDI